MTDARATEFVELWTCPKGDAAYAVQRGALTDSALSTVLSSLRSAAQEAERRHREAHPGHYATASVGLCTQSMPGMFGTPLSCDLLHGHVGQHHDGRSGAWWWPGDHAPDAG